MLLFTLLHLMGCDEAIVYNTSRCDVQITEITPTPLLTTETAEIIGHPFTETWDSLATIDGTEIEVTTVSRQNCQECDECRQSYLCSPCDDCDECDPICKADCVEKMEVVIPQDTEGNRQIQVTNSYGQSEPQMVEIQSTDPSR